MLFHENRLLADDSYEISYLIFFQKIRKDVAKCVVFGVLRVKDVVREENGRIKMLKAIRVYALNVF